jgi:hypothetical protein
MTIIERLSESTTAKPTDVKIIGQDHYWVQVEYRLADTLCQASLVIERD